MNVSRDYWNCYIYVPKPSRLTLRSLHVVEQSTVLDNASVVRGRVFRPWSPQLPLELLDGHLYRYRRIALHALDMV